METTALARLRTLSPPAFLRIALASCVALLVVVTSGAFVRLTGSGLGCDNWPRCGTRPYPEQGFHAFVEFGNRMVALVGLVLTLTTWVASRRVVALPRFARLAALGAFLGTAAQIPLGGITIVLGLNPLAVMAHFLLALTVLALALVTFVEAWCLVVGRARPFEPRWFRQFAVWAGLPTCAALVVTGAVATASGPHPGSSQDVKRIGITITDTVYVHVRSRRRLASGSSSSAGSCGKGVTRIRACSGSGACCSAWSCAQAVVGEVQYRNALPWWLVLVHVILAASIWVLTLAVAYALWRPPARLARQ